jgi:uncharacterized membrane protein
MERPTAPTPIPKSERLTHERLVEQYHSRLEFSRTGSEKFADWLTKQFGSVWFLACNVAFFALWLLWNTGVLGLTPFDTPPFIMLTMIVSLEAICLAIVVLISQNRQAKIADIQQKLDFEIDVRAEEEITKVLGLIIALHSHLGLSDTEDPELRGMLRKIDLAALRKRLDELEG